MRVFFDTEFTGLHQYTTLISIGCMAENGQYFYAELTDFDCAQVDEWIQENVIDNLILHPTDSTIWGDYSFRGNAKEICLELGKWLLQFDKVQMISDCLSYDWVLFCQMWEHAFNIPENVSPAPRDINQDIADYLEIDEKSAFDVNREEFAGLTSDTQKHNALWDARVIKACYEKLMKD